MNERPQSFCMAPWTHTYLSPQTERRMCCASREPAQNFRQYIDTADGTGTYKPLSLKDHWNSEHMRSVRRRMMSGEILPECEVCNERILNTEVYRDYFWRLFQHRYDEVWSSTSQDGTTSMQPVSWDYRFSNLCNFKCRMCGDMLSSSWETEQRQHGMIDWSNSKNHWMADPVRSEIKHFQQTQVEQEFAEAVEQHRIEEIYWVGGEPLMYEQHWRYMNRIIELGDAHRVYARYNTNLSRIDYGKQNLYRDILVHLRDWQICASIDGTGATGEYIRTGLDYNTWVENFKKGIEIQKNRRQMRIDFTLTLPGLTEVLAIEQLSKEFGVDLLAKVVFSFGPDIIMSPLALPRQILERRVHKLLGSVSTSVMKDLLQQLLKRPTLQEQWPDTWQDALRKGKARILKLESIRSADVTMADILSEDKEIHEWWQKIE